MSLGLLSPSVPVSAHLCSLWWALETGWAGCRAELLSLNVPRQNRGRFPEADVLPVPKLENQSSKGYPRDISLEITDAKLT